MNRILSPKQVAEAIGASESSLKRWTDDGAIRAVRTAGGHRRIPLAEVIRFVRATGTPVVQPEILGLRDLEGVSNAMPAQADEPETFLQLLQNGRAAEARGFILSLYLAGRSVEAICDGPLQHAMHRMGELYEHRADGVFIEHRATDIAMQALQQLRQLIEVPASAPTAVGGAAPGDVYVLPSLAAATVLASHGIEAVNLGADTPLDAIRAAALHHHARLAWLSVSVVPSMGAASLRDQVIALAEHLRTFGASLIVGGRAADAVLAKGVAGVFRGSSMAQLAAFAQGFVAQHDRQ